MQTIPGADAAVGGRLQDILGYHPSDLRFTGSGVALHQSAADSVMVEGAFDRVTFGMVQYPCAICDREAGPGLGCDFCLRIICPPHARVTNCCWFTICPECSCHCGAPPVGHRDRRGDVYPDRAEDRVYSYSGVDGGERRDAITRIGAPGPLRLAPSPQGPAQRIPLSVRVCRMLRDELLD